MAKKEKTPLPDDEPNGLIIALSVAAAFVASVTLALVVGIVAYCYNATTANQMDSAIQTPVVSTGAQSGAPSSEEPKPDASEIVDKPTDEPDDTEEPPQENGADQADTSQDPSAQTPNSDPGTSPDENGPPQSGGTAPPDSDSGTNSGGVTTQNQPQASGTQSDENTGNRDFSGGRVLATTASNNNNDPVYHTKNCSSAQKIAASDEKWYNSAADAEADGRRLCGICGR